MEKQEKLFFLKPTSDKIKPFKIFGFDIETQGKYNKFVMGSLINETEKYIFWNKKEMQNFILYDYKLRNSLIFATNLNFDFFGLFDTMQHLFKFDYIMRNGNLINVKYKNKNNKNKNAHYTINFRDTMNFLRFGVKNIGNIINIHKLKSPEFLGKKPKTQEEKDYLEKYNIQDSYISFKFMDMVQKGFNDLGTNLKYTIASSGMSLFRNKYLKYWIEQPPKNTIETLFKAYHGARTEIFIRGKISEEHNLNYFDFNSLYPFCMNEYPYPYPNSMKISNNPSISLINSYHGITKVKFMISNLYIPLLPVRYNNKLYFPLGLHTGWYSNIELRKALKLGYDIQPLKSIYYLKNFNPFKKYVEDLYKKRTEYKKSKYNTVYKILLNSLYGKFAQKLEQENIYFVKNEEHNKIINKCLYYNRLCAMYNKDIRYDINIPNMNEKNGICYPQIYYIKDLNNKSYPKFINPILSLYITAYARLRLYNYMEEIINNNNKLYYCDTDSLITNHKFKTSDKLGMLKNEMKIKKGILIKPKFYYLKGYDKQEMYRIKGVMGINTYEDFKKLLILKQVKYTKFTKFKESIRRKFKFNEQIEVIKYLDLEDNKRYWKKTFNHEKTEKSFPMTLM